MNEVFDSYIHCGLSKYRPLEDVLDVHRAAGVLGGVLMQHLGEFDNSYIIEAAERAGPSYRAVVLVDQSASSWRTALGQLRSQRGVAGVRIAAAPDDLGWIEVADAAASSGMPVVYYLPKGADGIRADLERLAVTYPTVPFILTHLGTPRLTLDVDADVAHLAKCKNFVLQVSGFCMWSQLPYEETVTCARNLIRAFGRGRVIWGSNFPVCAFESQLAYVKSNPWDIGIDDLEALLYLNAKALWGIE
jgi:predicted TIM-barrel fold metal-dependent hydrolase